MSGKKKIMVIDDETDFQEILSYNLEKEGYSVVSFENPIPAIGYLNKNRVSLILTDWLMPQMDGLEFCRYLKADSVLRKIPLVMITCKSEESDLCVVLEAGATDCIVKPFILSELISRIKSILASPM
jgi:DNA-binding response OmpR family regulator